MYTLPFTLSANTETILLLISLLVTALLIVSILILHVRLRHFMRGANAASLESTLTAILKDHGAFETFQKEMEHALKNLDERLIRATQGIGTVRFDAFSGDGSGGKQSFATAFVSESGEGVVISSLHARASTRIFAKPVSGFTSQNELTDEEREAISSARTHIKQ